MCETGNRRDCRSNDHRLRKYPRQLVGDFRKRKTHQEKDEEAEHECRVALARAFQPVAEHAHKRAAEQCEPEHEHRGLGQFDKEHAWRLPPGKRQDDGDELAATRTTTNTVPGAQKSGR